MIKFLTPYFMTTSDTSFFVQMLDNTFQYKNKSRYSVHCVVVVRATHCSPILPLCHIFIYRYIVIHINTLYRYFTMPYSSHVIAMISELRFKPQFTTWLFLNSTCIAIKKPLFFHSVVINFMSGGLYIYITAYIYVTACMYVLQLG